MSGISNHQNKKKHEDERPEQFNRIFQNVQQFYDDLFHRLSECPESPVVGGSILNKLARARASVKTQKKILIHHPLRPYVLLAGRS